MRDRERRTGDQQRVVDIGQLLAYVLIIIVAGLGFYSTDRTNDRMCESARENRVALQNLTTGVYSLGLNLIVDGEPRHKWSPEEEDAVEDLQKFLREQEKLLELPVC